MANGQTYQTSAANYGAEVWSPGKGAGHYMDKTGTSRTSAANYGFGYPSTGQHCLGDEMDLCVELDTGLTSHHIAAGYDYNTGRCAEDEQDLCEDLPFVDMTNKYYPDEQQCGYDEMDLCEHPYKPVEGSCDSDEMDLCQIAICDEDEMDLCQDMDMTTWVTPGGSNVAMKTFGGRVGISATGVTKAQMETAMTKSLAKKFSVSEKSVHVQAKESRRLMEGEGLRRLAGQWAIDYTVTAPATEAVAIASKITELQASPVTLQPEIKAQLTAAGVAQSAVDSLAVVWVTGGEVTKIKKNGQLSVVAPNAQMSQVGVAATAVLAKQFGVSETAVVVTVRDKAWITANMPSGTAGDFGIEWIVYVASSYDVSAKTKSSSLVLKPSDLNLDMRTEMLKQGYAPEGTAISQVSISYFKDLSAATIGETETSGAFSVLRESGKYSLVLAIVMSTFTSTKISLPALWQQGQMVRA